MAMPLPQHELEMLLNEPVTSLDGLAFTPSDDSWGLSNLANIHGALDVFRASLTFPAEVRPYFRLALARYAQSYAADTVVNVVRNCYQISSGGDQPNNWLDEAFWLSAKAHLGKKREYKLGAVRGFLRFWFESGLYGIDADFMSTIRQMTFRGGEKGTRVKAEDPINGPLTELEHVAVLTEANNAYMDDRISTQQMLLVKLFSERGLRRKQAVQLFVSDFYKRDGKFFINQPRGKQRHAAWRVTFTTFEVSETLYSLVQAVKSEYLADITASYGEEVAAKTDDLPLFPEFEYLVIRVNAGEAIDASCCWMRERATWEMSALARPGRINAFSERTGELINLHPQRFRYSLGSDMDREGYGVGVIAAALDHEDNQNAGVYVGMSEAMAHRLDAKIGPLLAPLAQAFSGVIVANEQEAVRGNDPSSRIRTIDGSDNVGTCGNFAYCGANAPVSCYTCAKFHPWRDGPHEEILADLYEERDEILRITHDATMASVNDRTILAVEEVVKRCKGLTEEAVRE